MRVRRGALLDVLVEDNRAAVFVDGHVVVLSEMATTILAATPVVGTTDLEQLTEAVVEELGPPPAPHRALDLTHGQVLELVQHHVLEVAPGPDS